LGHKLKGGRLRDEREYYRFTAPEFSFDGKIVEETISVGPNAIIMFPDGGVAYAANRKPLYAGFPVAIVTAAPN